VTEPAASSPDAPGPGAPGSDAYDARTGSGDPGTDPAAVGEVSFEEPDGDGGAAPDEPVHSG
jgi:hypothetical protein